MKFFLVAFIFLLSLGQLQRVQLTANLAFYLHDVLLVFFLLWQIFAGKVTRKKIIFGWKKIPQITKKIVIGLFLVILLGWAVAAWQNRFDWRLILYLGRLLSYLAFVFLLQKQLHWPSWPWRLISFNLLVLGFAQYLLLPDLRFLVFEGYDDHFYRMSGSILDPSFLGLIFVFNLNYYLWQKKQNWLLIGLFAIGLLLTYSRAAYLALIVSSLIYLWLRRDEFKKSLVVFLAIFILAWPFLPTRSGGDGVDLLRQSSVAARLSNDRQILEQMNKSEWLIGQGLFIPNRNVKNSENTPIHAHFADNLFVFLLSSLGILGSGLLLILLWQSLSKASKEQWVLLSSLLTHAMFNHNISQSFVLLIFLGFFWSQKTLNN
jgi:hypothetical protein